MATIAATDYQMPIGGEWGESDGGRFEVTNPATGAVVGTAVNATADDVRRAIDAAEEALGPWQALAAIERGRILRRASDRILAEADHIAGVMTDEQGKPLAEARGEVVYAASFLEWFAGEAERVYGMTLPPMNPQKRVLVLRQPVGVTAAITPWNFPAAMMTRKLGPALAAGCTMIVKPASATPLTALEVVRCMEEAGVPAGVVNVITSRRTADVANALFTDPRVRKISFTGSTEVGKELIRASADQVKRLSLELGGPRAVRHLRGRRHRGGGRRHDGLEVPQRRPDLRLREPHLRAAQHPRRVRQGARAPGRRDEGRQRSRRGRRRSARSSTPAASPRPTSTSRTPSPRAPTCWSAARRSPTARSRTARSTRPRCSTT